MSTHASARRWAGVRLSSAAGGPHHRVDSCLQSGAAFSVELSVDAKHAVEGLAQIKEAAIVLFVGVFENLIRLQAVPQHSGRATQAARIEVFGCRDENALGVRIHLAA